MTRGAAGPVVILAAAGALLAAACGDAPGAAPSAPPLPDEAAFLAQVDRTRGVRDGFVPLVDPPFVPAADAPAMRDEEMVLALEVAGETACYPVAYLNHHEIVEHRLGGVDVLVCWCPLCRTGAAHERTLDGRTLRFGHSGWLWHNAYLLYDRETESLWHHERGTAFSGPLRGRTLRRLPVRFLTFGAWRAERPRTLVLRKPAPEAGLETGRDAFDVRNARLTHGYAVDVGPASRFWRLSALAAGPVEETVGGAPLVAVRDPGAATAFVYDRRVGGATVSFDVDTGRPGARALLRERGGRRAWSLRTGDPVPETGAAEPLRPLAGSVWEEAAWTLQHPAGSVHPAPPAR